jgi:hypothetical protein
MKMQTLIKQLGFDNDELTDATNSVAGSTGTRRSTSSGGAFGSMKFKNKKTNVVTSKCFKA